MSISRICPIYVLYMSKICPEFVLVQVLSKFCLTSSIFCPINVPTSEKCLGFVLAKSSQIEFLSMFCPCDSTSTIRQSLDKFWPWCFFHFPPGNPAPRQKLDKLWIWILYSASLDVFGQRGQNLDKSWIKMDFGQTLDLYKT